MIKKKDPCKENGVQLFKNVHRKDLQGNKLLQVVRFGCESAGSDVFSFLLSLCSIYSEHVLIL